MAIYSAKASCLFECQDQDIEVSFSLAAASLNLIREEILPVVRMYIANENHFKIVFKIILLVFALSSPLLLKAVFPFK